MLKKFMVHDKETEKKYVQLVTNTSRSFISAVTLDVKKAVSENELFDLDSVELVYKEGINSIKVIIRNDLVFYIHTYYKVTRNISRDVIGLSDIRLIKGMFLDV